MRAPIDGTEQQLAIHTVCGVVSPAQQLMMIVPRGSSIEVEAMISNRDIGFVEHGQDAEIKIDTLNFTRYGLLHGNVISVSRDAIIKDKLPGGPGALKQGGALAESSEPAGQELLYAARVSLDGGKMQVEDKMVKPRARHGGHRGDKSGQRRIIES